MPLVPLVFSCGSAAVFPLAFDDFPLVFLLFFLMFSWAYSPTASPVAMFFYLHFGIDLDDILG